MAVTTICKDSQIGDAWIQQAYASNPVQFVVDIKTGQPTGDILTGPVRLAFCDSLFVAKPKMSTDPTSKLAFMTTLLWPVVADVTILMNEYYRIAGEKFANHWNGQAYVGIDEAIKDQGDKFQMSGYTPGSKYTTVSSQFKPPIVDSRMNPIVDQSQIYAGCWCIASVNVYASGIGTPRKGPRFGLQTLMKIADDTNLGGAAKDPRAQFASAKVIPPSGPVAAAFGAAPPPGGQPQFGPAAVAQIQTPQQQWSPPTQAWTPPPADDSSQFN